MAFEIYIIKNSVNEKIYVGQTVAGIAKRWSQHKADARKKRSKLYYAMRKHGVCNFYIQKVCSCKDVEELNGIEEFLIKALGAVRHGYNTLAGGQNYEREMNRDKLIKRVVALFSSPPSKETSIRKFKVLLSFIKYLSSLPDAPNDAAAVYDVSEEDVKWANKKLKYMLFQGWPGERVSAAFILFMCLCNQKGILNG